MASESKEVKYQRLLAELGVYTPAFDPTIHDLCVTERELSRAMKAWKNTAPKGEAPLATDPLYPVIQKQRRDILAYRESLGLTPKGLQRLRRQMIPSEPSAPAPSTGNAAFGDLLTRMKENANGSAP